MSEFSGNSSALGENHSSILHPHVIYLLNGYFMGPEAPGSVVGAERTALNKTGSPCPQGASIPLGNAAGIDRNRVLGEEGLCIMHTQPRLGWSDWLPEGEGRSKELPE